MSTTTLTITFCDGSQQVFTIKDCSISWKEVERQLVFKGIGQHNEIMPRNTDRSHDGGCGYQVSWESKHKRYSFVSFSLPPCTWQEFTFLDVHDLKIEDLHPAPASPKSQAGGVTMSVTIYGTYEDGSQNNSLVEGFSYSYDPVTRQITAQGQKAEVTSTWQDHSRRPLGTDHERHIQWEQDGKCVSFYSIDCPYKSWHEFTFREVRDFKIEDLHPAPASTKPAIKLTSTHTDGTIRWCLVEDFESKIKQAEDGFWDIDFFGKVKEHGPEGKAGYHYYGDDKYCLTYSWEQDGLRHIFESYCQIDFQVATLKGSHFGKARSYRTEPLTQKSVTLTPEPVFVLHAPQAQLTRLSSWGCWCSVVSNLKLEIAAKKVTLTGNGGFLRLDQYAHKTQTDVWQTKDPDADTLLTLEIENQKHELLLKKVQFSGPSAGMPATGFLYQATLVEHLEKVVPAPAPSAPSPVPTSLAKSEPEKTVLWRLYDTGWGNRLEVSDFHCTISPDSKRFLLQGKHSKVEAPPCQQLDPLERARIWPGEGLRLSWIQDSKEHHLYTTRESSFDYPTPASFEMEGEILRHDITELDKKPEPESNTTYTISSDPGDYVIASPDKLPELSPVAQINAQTIPVTSWDVKPLQDFPIDYSWVQTPPKALSVNEVRDLCRVKYVPAEAAPEPVPMEARKLVAQIKVPYELLGIPSERPEQDPFLEVCNEKPAGRNLPLDVYDGLLGACLTFWLCFAGVTMFEYFEKLSGKDLETLIRGAILGIASSLISLAIIKLMKWAVTRKPPVPESVELLKLKELFLSDKVTLADSQSFVKILGSNNRRYDLNSDGSVDTFPDDGKPIRIELSASENKQRIKLFQEAKAACLARQHAVTQKHQQDLLNNLRTLKV